jgi:hypothetical protein
MEGGSWMQRGRDAGAARPRRGVVGVGVRALSARSSRA